MAFSTERLPSSVSKNLAMMHDTLSSDGVLLAQTRRGVQLLRGAWQDADVPEEEINCLLDDNSAPNWEHFDIEKIEHLIKEESPQRVVSELLSLFTPFYKPVQRFLNLNGHNSEHGFNSHTLQHHILPMVKMALELSRQLKLDKQTRNQLLFAIFLHDISNSQSRKWHGLALYHMIPLLFGNENIFNSQVLSSAFFAAVTHDESTAAIPILTRIAGNVSNKQSSPEQLADLDKELTSNLTVIQALLLLIDKIHLGEDRVINGKSITKKSLEEDRHFLVNLPFKIDKMGVVGREFRVVYSFSFRRGDDEEIPPNIHAYGGKIPGKKSRKLSVPQSMKDTYWSEGVSFFEQISKMAIDLYHQRWVVAAAAAFRLHGPAVIDSFDVVFLNSDPEGGQFARTFRKTWTREQMWQDLLDLERKDDK